MDGGATTILLDPAIRDWVLLPIMLVMLEIGVLRHYVTQLLGIGGPPTQTALTAGSVPKSPTDSLKTIRES
jgi:hypothetical protein